MVLAIEWPLFLVLACYLDTVLDTGHAVPRHPLFCLGRNFSERVADEDVEAAQVCAEACRDDVAAEKERVLAMVSGQKEPEAVVVQEIAKTFPASFGSAATPAVRSLSLAVPHGECFGMLGPNGAGEIAKMIPLLPALHGRHRPRCKHACMHACIHRHTHSLSLSHTHTYRKDNDNQHAHWLRTAHRRHGFRGGAGRSHRHEEDLLAHGRLPPA